MIPFQTPDGKTKLAQLVRANQALYNYATGFGTPLISGKDSMKNDYKIGTVKISVPPTLLVSAVAKIDDYETAITMDVKHPGDLVYVVGITKNEWGGSEFALMMNMTEGVPPSVDVVNAKKLYERVHLAIKRGLVASCHDCSEGGLGVALAESAFAGGLGMDISLKEVPCEGDLTAAELLFSESASRFVVTVNPSLASAFESALAGCTLACVGRVLNGDSFAVRGLADEMQIETTLDALKQSWQKSFNRKRG